MDHTYLKIDNYTTGQMIYFTATIIKEFNSYQRGVEYCDYYLQIKMMNTYSLYTDEAFEEEFGGLFVCMDNSNNIRMYDNVNKEFLDIESYKDCKNLFYLYNEDTKIHTSLSSVIKEALYDIFIIPQTD